MAMGKRTTDELLEKYKAAMVLSGVGDALGFRNGHWEFCRSGEQIHSEVRRLGGLHNIHVKCPHWRVSDDTVMHLATAKALLAHGCQTSKESLYVLIATMYKGCMKDMKGREPGETCMQSCRLLDCKTPLGCSNSYNPHGGGCGAAMRSMCIGLRYPMSNEMQNLLEISIESGRLTHHHPTGYLGALASALFASFAIQQKPLCQWGLGLVNILPVAKKYINERGNNVEENLSNWDFFESRWKEYLKIRKIETGNGKPAFPAQYDIRSRDQFYNDLSFDGCGGSSGHDAPMIAYDALLGCNEDWNELCSRAMFHGGDSDTTGCIAGFLFGALYGFKKVPYCNYQDLEYRLELENVAKNMYKITWA